MVRGCRELTCEEKMKRANMYCLPKRPLRKGYDKSLQIPSGCKYQAWRGTIQYKGLIWNNVMKLRKEIFRLNIR